MEEKGSPKTAYIREIRIKNIRSIRSLNWRLPDDAHGAGWHVSIGDNGSGKSTFLRAIALDFIGSTEASALRQDWNEWLTVNEHEGEIIVRLDDSRLIELVLKRRDSNQVAVSVPNIYMDSREIFSASYGPFRRFSGGSYDQQQIFRSNPRVARHLSVFGEDVALTEYLSWLQNLQFRRLEQKADAVLLDKVKAFVNQEGFLPYRARLSNISSEGVQFLDADGYEVSVDALSDGYRSILSMTFELIRQLAAFYGPDGVFDDDDPTVVKAGGVVLIDEVDAHLHPTWQRRIGRWLRRHFPNIQFIVTTHSPLVCQAADVGSVFRLPRPGGDDEAEMLSGIELDRLLYGNVLDAYGTEAFGDIGRSDKAQEMLQELARLNIKEIEEGLAEDEKAQQERLRAAMPTSAYTFE